MDGAVLYMLIVLAVVVPISAFIWFMARRERLREEAEEESRRASGTAAE